MRLTIIFTFLVLFFSCSVSKNYPEENILISMEKTACRGHCPVYSIIIYKNGFARFEGKEHVNKIGEYKTKISKDELNRLSELFEENDFFNFENSYTSLYKDLPTTYIYFSFKGKSKRIKDYDGAPEKLKEIEKEIAKLIDSLKWKKVKSK